MRQRIQAVKKRGRGRVEKFIANAEDPPRAGSRCLFPTAPSDNLLQRNAVARSAPGGDDNLRIEFGNFVESDPLTWLCNEFASRRFY